MAAINLAGPLVKTLLKKKIPFWPLQKKVLLIWVMPL